MSNYSQHNVNCQASSSSVCPPPQLVLLPKRTDILEGRDKDHWFFSGSCNEKKNKKTASQCFWENDTKIWSPWGISITEVVVAFPALQKWWVLCYDHKQHLCFAMHTLMEKLGRQLIFFLVCLPFFFFFLLIQCHYFYLILMQTNCRFTFVNASSYCLSI